MISLFFALSFSTNTTVNATKKDFKVPGNLSKSGALPHIQKQKEIPLTGPNMTQNSSKLQPNPQKKEIHAKLPTNSSHKELTKQNTNKTEPMTHTGLNASKNANISMHNAKSEKPIKLKTEQTHKPSGDANNTKKTTHNATNANSVTNSTTPKKIKINHDIILPNKTNDRPAVIEKTNSTSTPDNLNKTSENLPKEGNITQKLPKYPKYAATQQDNEKPLKLNNEDPINKMKHFNEYDPNKTLEEINPMNNTNKEEKVNIKNPPPRPGYLKYSQKQPDKEKPRQINHADSAELIEHYFEIDNRTQVEEIIPWEDKTNETTEEKTAEPVKIPAEPKYLKYSKTQSDDEKPLKLNNEKPLQDMQHINEYDPKKPFVEIIPMKDVNNTEQNTTNLPENPTNITSEPKYLKYAKKQPDDEKPAKLNNEKTLEDLEHINEYDPNKPFVEVNPMKNTTEIKSEEKPKKELNTENKIEEKSNTTSQHQQIEQKKPIPENQTNSTAIKQDKKPITDNRPHIKPIQDKKPENTKENKTEEIEIEKKPVDDEKPTENKPKEEEKKPEEKLNEEIVEKPKEEEKIAEKDNEKPKEEEEKKNEKPREEQKVEEKKGEEPDDDGDKEESKVEEKEVAKEDDEPIPEKPKKKIEEDEEENKDDKPIIRHYRRPTIVEPPSMWDDIMANSGKGVIGGIALFLSASIFAVWYFVFKPNRTHKHSIPKLLREIGSTKNEFEIDRGDLDREDGKTF